MRICKIKDCGRKHSAKGYCFNHYSNFLRTGNPLGKFNGDQKARYNAQRVAFVCKIKNCNLPHFSKGYCHKHYSNFLRTQNPLGKSHKCFAKNCNRKTTNPKYCSVHSRRNKLHRSLDLSIKYTLKGRRNYRWNGGISQYPNHYLMKKNRLIILMQNPKCEYCGKPATQVHHKDGSKTNHDLSNLAATCQSCNSKIRFAPNNSKYRRLYGSNLKGIAERIGYSKAWLVKKHEQGILQEIILSNPKIFTLDKKIKIWL